MLSAQLKGTTSDGKPAYIAPQNRCLRATSSLEYITDGEAGSEISEETDMQESVSGASPSADRSLMRQEVVEKNPITIYKGKRKNGIMHGKGVAHFLNGDMIEGVWVYGVLDGVCLQTTGDGTEYMCTYRLGYVVNTELVGTYKGRKLLALYEEQMKLSSRALTFNAPKSPSSSAKFSLGL